MVAFFKASEVLFRSVRAANNKRKNQNRNKSSSHQESSRMPSVGGKMKLWFTSLFRGVMGTCSNGVESQHLNKILLIGWTVRTCVPTPFPPAPLALLKPLLLCWSWAWFTFWESGHFHVSWTLGRWNAQVVWERLHLSLKLVLCSRQLDEIFATHDKKVERIERRVAPQMHPNSGGSLSKRQCLDSCLTASQMKKPRRNTKIWTLEMRKLNQSMKV